MLRGSNSHFAISSQVLSAGRGHSPAYRNAVIDCNLDRRKLGRMMIISLIRRFYERGHFDGSSLRIFMRVAQDRRAKS